MVSLCALRPPQRRAPEVGCCAVATVRQLETREQFQSSITYGEHINVTKFKNCQMGQAHIHTQVTPKAPRSPGCRARTALSQMFRPPPLIIRVWHQTAQALLQMSTLQFSSPVCLCGPQFRCSSGTVSRPIRVEGGRGAESPQRWLALTHGGRSAARRQPASLHRYPTISSILYQFYFSGKHVAPICIFFPLRWHVFLLNPSDQNRLLMSLRRRCRPSVKKENDLKSYCQTRPLDLMLAPLGRH